MANNYNMSKNEEFVYNRSLIIVGCRGRNSSFFFALTALSSESYKTMERDSILYEEASFLVVNKPSSLLTQAAAGVPALKPNSRPSYNSFIRKPRIHLWVCPIDWIAELQVFCSSPETNELSSDLDCSFNHARSSRNTWRFARERLNQRKELGGTLCGRFQIARWPRSCLRIIRMPKKRSFTFRP